jgi:hypothetical protein
VGVGDTVRVVVTDGEAVRVTAVWLGVGGVAVFVAVLVAVRVGVFVGVLVAVRVGVFVGVFVAVRVGVFVAVFVAVRVGVTLSTAAVEDGVTGVTDTVGVSGVTVTEGVTGVNVTVTVGVRVTVDVDVDVTVDVGVPVSVGVLVEVCVAVAVDVSVGVAVDVSVGVAVSVGVDVSVTVAVAVLVGVGVSSTIVRQPLSSPSGRIGCPSTSASSMSRNRMQVVPVNLGVKLSVASTPVPDAPSGVGPPVVQPTRIVFSVMMSWHVTGRPVLPSHGPTT